MAVYNPHLLSHKLCRVLDAGYATVDQIAKAAGESPRLIEKLARGEFPLNEETKLRIGMALSPYFRAHPELYRDPERPVRRGVFEVELRHRGWRGFEVKDSAGKTIVYVEWPKERATQERIDGLWRILDRDDPVPQLRVI